MATFTVLSTASKENIQVVLDRINEPLLTYLDFQHVSDGQAVDTMVYLGQSEPNFDDWLYWANRCNRDVFVCTAAVSPQSALSDFHLEFEELLSNELARDLFLEILLGRVDPAYDGPRLVLVPDNIASPYSADSKEKLVELIEDKSVRRISIEKSLADSIRLAKDLPGGKFRNRGDYELARYVKNAASRFDKSLVKLRVDFTGSENITAPILQGSATELLLDARASNLVILLGIPGAGKSVQLQSVDEMFALEAINSKSPDSAICFCVNLGEHASQDQDVAPFLWLKKRWESRFDKTSLPFDDQLKDSRLVFLLDGFNEIPFSNSEDRRNWMLRWKACIHEELLSNPKVKVVVACRSRDTQISFGSEDTPATTATVAPLSKLSILDLARRTSFAGYIKLKEAFEHDPTLEQLYRTPYTLYHFLDISRGPVPRTQSEVFWRRIASAVEREREIVNPIIGGPWVPDEFAYELVNADNSRSAVAALRSMPLFKALGALAFWMSDGGSNGGQHRSAISLLEDFEKWLEEAGVFHPGVERAQFRALAENFSILIENEGYLKFSHQSLQDFFCVVGESRQSVLGKASLSSADFERLLEPIDQALGSTVQGDVLPVLPSTGFDEALARLVEIDPSAVRPAIDANPWVMAEIFGKEKAFHDDEFSYLVEALEVELEPETDVRVRLASLWALGLIGWRRSSNHGELSPRMIEIQGRTWRLGVTKAQAKKLNLSAHQKARRKKVAAFNVGVYPVTNQEFEKFWEVGGYETEDFWSTEGWRWRSGEESESKVYTRWLERRNRVAADRFKPVRLIREKKASLVEAAAILRFAKMSDEEIGEYVRALVGKKVDTPAFWHSPRYNNPLQPVVGVSFFEAEAYCNWLSAETGMEYRLPTEAEWEAAALLSWNSDYYDASAIGEIVQPNSWSENWGNTAEMHLGQPSPTGALKTGGKNSVEAPKDMAGNVFEWVTDRVNETEDWCLVVKGGSFRHLMHRSHPGYRGRGDKTSRNDDNGFRVVSSK